MLALAGVDCYTQQAVHVIANPLVDASIGSNQPVELGLFIETLENALGVKAKKEMLPMQPGDVKDTFADVESLVGDMGYKPTTNLEAGIGEFVSWYKSYYL